MGLDRLAFERLRTAASGFDTKNHQSYLAELLQCIRDTGDPLDGLRLLHALWGSPYASRPDQKTALNAVGRWLEARLVREPTAARHAVMLEIGWLRRLSCALGKRRSEERSARSLQAGTEPRVEPRLGFGSRIAWIDEARSAVPATSLARERSARPVVEEAPAPDRLPDVFEAEFEDFADARHARQTAQRRAKQGKPPKDRLVGVRPVDPRLRSLGGGLVCSVRSTVGFGEPFMASEKMAGAPCSFYVGAIEERDGKKVISRIMLDPPVEPGLAS